MLFMTMLIVSPHPLWPRSSALRCVLSESEGTVCLASAGIDSPCHAAPSAPKGPQREKVPRARTPSSAWNSVSRYSVRNEPRGSLLYYRRLSRAEQEIRLQDTYFFPD